ncbi:hypothetical protein YQE_10658, partial [Dendroctonus ponderosae]
MARRCPTLCSDLLRASDLCVAFLPLSVIMKVLILLTITLSVVVAQKRPQGFQSEQYEDQQQTAAAQETQPRQREVTTPIPIIRFDKEQGNDGSYKALWETGNNILAQEEGFLKELGPDPDQEGGVINAQVQQGSYTYTAPDGQIITVNYVADERGFHASGDHLPTPPPVSPEVQKGLDLIYAGIKAQQEADEREAKEHPESQRNANQIEQDYSGQYKQ